LIQAGVSVGTLSLVQAPVMSRKNKTIIALFIAFEGFFCKDVYRVAMVGILAVR